MMSETAEDRTGISVDNAGRRCFNKHVTTACQACRRKRSKCDGHLPCSTCNSDEDSCIYNHNDGRRQRHSQKPVHKQPLQRTIVQTVAEAICDEHKGDQIKSNVPISGTMNMIHVCGDSNEVTRETVPGSNVIPALQNNRNVDSDKIPKGIKLQNPAIPDNKMSYKISGIQSSGHYIPNIAPASKSSGRSHKHHNHGLSAMQSMQGQFETRAKKLSHNSGSVCSTRRRLLAKASSTSRTSCVAGIMNHKQSADQQEQHQSVWRLERRGYAVPGYARTFGNLSFSSSITTNGYPVNVQAHQARNFSAPEHLVFPLVDLDESPLGRAYTDFQQLGQRLIAEGVHPSQVADQGPIDVTLFFRERMPEDPVNASTWASEMLRAFRGIFSDQLLLGCAVCVGNLMRWFLMPTPENYANLPSTMRPTKLQKFKPHPSWVDLMVFPSFRDALILKLRDWVEPCVKARWEILWPHSLEEALNYHTLTQRTFLTQEFATYAVNPKNWLMQRSILDEFSEIEGSEINISPT